METKLLQNRYGPSLFFQSLLSIITPFPYLWSYITLYSVLFHTQKYFIYIYFTLKVNLSFPFLILWCHFCILDTTFLPPLLLMMNEFFKLSH